MAYDSVLGRLVPHGKAGAHISHPTSSTRSSTGALFLQTPRVVGPNHFCLVDTVGMHPQNGVCKCVCWDRHFFKIWQGPEYDPFNPPPQGCRKRGRRRKTEMVSGHSCGGLEGHAVQDMQVEWGQLGAR